jgi:hypothetical protein
VPSAHFVDQDEWRLLRPRGLVFATNTEMAMVSNVKLLTFDISGTCDGGCFRWTAAQFLPTRAVHATVPVPIEIPLYANADLYYCQWRVVLFANPGR